MTNNFNETFSTHSSTSSNSKVLEMVEQNKKILQRLRNNVLGLNKLAENLCSKEASPDHAKKTLKIFAEQILQDYENVESDAIALQQHSLVNPEMNRLQTFLLDALADPANKTIYSKAVKLATSFDTSTAYYSFAIEFLKIFSQSQSRKPPKLTPEIYYSNQINFDENLNKWVALPGRANIFKIKFLERNACGSIVECRFYYPSNIITGVLKMKILFLVSNGLFEYAQVVAPHEEWRYTNASRTQVDISIPSRYESYQRLTDYANTTCGIVSNSNYGQLDTKIYINHVLTLFLKIPTFEYPCRNCKRFLRDFMPALIDSRDRRACYHQACR